MHNHCMYTWLRLCTVLIGLSTLSCLFVHFVMNAVRKHASAVECVCQQFSNLLLLNFCLRSRSSGWGAILPHTCYSAAFTSVVVFQVWPKERFWESFLMKIVWSRSSPIQVWKTAFKTILLFTYSFCYLLSDQHAYSDTTTGEAASSVTPDDVSSARDAGESTSATSPPLQTDA